MMCCVIIIDDDDDDVLSSSMMLYQPVTASMVRVDVGLITNGVNGKSGCRANHKLSRAQGLLSIKMNASRSGCRANHKWRQREEWM